jgi:ATP-dependent DNA helicase RecQ
MDLQIAQKALKRYFGYSQFRPLQEEIIQSVYDGRDALVLMPTGGGKSICYQIPAVTMPGTCIVVSPLISLMKDQVEGLLTNGISAAYLNSAQTGEEQRRVENDFFGGKLDLLYISPEKLVSPGFLPLLKSVKINLFAVDEAHCISSWGHDFRPEYTQLRFVKQQFPNIPIVALTATADKITRQDIAQQLQIQQTGLVYIASFDRPNLSLTVAPGQKRLEQMLEFIKKRPKLSGIVYCLSRKSTEELAGKLQAQGLKAAAYHAGLSSQLRSKVQEDFINDKTPIICATIAFGMGIDKSNVRWIIHYNLPKNLEGYYQEIGRAGRDGAKADALLFYSFNDVAVLQDIINGNPNEQTEVQLMKLERMRQYAEALACRRRILLAYFGENTEKDCGNCDVCKDPPQYFDGTVIAQKALSAIYRVDQQVGINLLIDILRGSNRKEIIQLGFDQIKTYGVGRELSQWEWQQYLAQLVNLGYIEVAYNENNLLRLTEPSKGVLFNQQKVQLVKTTTFKERQEKEKVQVTKQSRQEKYRDELFEALREVRTTVSRVFGLPPYLVFSDATLEEMARRKPTNEKEMLQVPGVGEKKLEQFGHFFLEKLLELTEPKDGGNGIKTSTYQITQTYLKQGLSPDEIARVRDVTIGTVFSHIAHLYEKGESIDISFFVTQEELQTIIKSFPYLQKPNTMKDISEYFEGKYNYNQIRLAIAHQRKMGG